MTDQGVMTVPVNNPLLSINNSHRFPVSVNSILATMLGFECGFEFVCMYVCMTEFRTR